MQIHTVKRISQIRNFSALLGGIIYMSGDTIATLMISEFGFIRVVGIFIVGCTLYAWEIQKYFRFIEKKVSLYHGWKKASRKAMMALIYFNPLWITRHLCFIYIFSGRASEISLSLFITGLVAFLVNIPVSIVANFVIQNKIPLSFRFWASAIFSGIMAIYYSMSSVWF